MGEEVGVDLLAHAVRQLAAQHAARATQVGLEFVVGGFELPAVAVENGEFFGRRGAGIQEAGDETIDGQLGPTPGIIHDKLDHADQDAVALVFTCNRGGVDVRQVRAIGEAAHGVQAQVLLHTPHRRPARRLPATGRN